MKNKLFLIAVLAIFGGVTNCSAQGRNEDQTYRYTAAWIALDPGTDSGMATITFAGSKLITNDVIRGFSGCRIVNGQLSISSELQWLNFDINIEGGSDLGQQSHDTEKEVLFTMHSTMLGLDVRIFGVRYDDTSTTVIYLNKKKGIIGLGWIGRNYDMWKEDAIPIYWLEGTYGLCHGKSND